MELSFKKNLCCWNNHFTRIAGLQLWLTDNGHGGEIPSARQKSPSGLHYKT